MCLIRYFLLPETNFLKTCNKSFQSEFRCAELHATVGNCAQLFSNCMQLYGIACNCAELRGIARSLRNRAQVKCTCNENPTWNLILTKAKIKKKIPTLTLLPNILSFWHTQPGVNNLIFGFKELTRGTTSWLMYNFSFFHLILEYYSPLPWEESILKI